MEIKYIIFNSLKLYIYRIINMDLSNAPLYRDFTFVYKGLTILVPVALNEVARNKPKSFWDWLLFKYTFDSYIELTVEHLIEEEET